jgi:2-C-methyl-D-erythritol 4-phosphate cytidylyltransferase/2-C-methyl-D-erythritol 2,4-cyclodiphosphate synthase
MRDVKTNTWAIVAAAGSGVRFGAAAGKQFVQIQGMSLLQRTLRSLEGCPDLQGMVVVVPPDRVAELHGRPGLRVVAGGERRTDSVRAGFAALPDDCNLVLVHDGVRPGVTPELVRRVIEVAWSDGACVPVLRVNDTVKAVDAAGRVVRTLEREPLRLVQTPQGFRREVLRQAYAWADENGGPGFTDDAALVEASSQRVTVVAGEEENIKVTVPGDLVRLGLLAPRVGHGYDVHRLEPGRKLILGGVEIEHDRGLLGHSDGDAALHALCDALLGAAGLPDIGRQFPDTDPKYAGVASLDLLREAAALVRRAGWRASSADLTLVAERPRLAGHLPRMAKGIAKVLEVEPEAVGVKATTEEGLGFTGQGEGIAAHAMVVLVPAWEAAHG